MLTVTKDTVQVTRARPGFCELQHRQLSSLAWFVDAEVTPSDTYHLYLTAGSTYISQWSWHPDKTLYHLERSGNEAETAPGEILQL